MQRVGDIIAQDVGMSAKILQMVHSAFFGVRVHVPNPAQAAILLGTETMKMLVLSANTSFVDFPRLCHLVAEDGFLPRPFAIPGRRLVYSVGILFLAVGAGGLLVAFGGITPPAPRDP